MSGMPAHLSGTGDDTPFVSTGSLPPADLVQSLVTEAHERFRSVGDGTNSDVYPALERVPPELFGICVVGTSGTVYAAGDTEVEFSIMSVAKPFVFALVCQAVGPDVVRDRIGVNATGLAFNSLEAIERGANGRTNPMVNPGAIAGLTTATYVLIAVGVFGTLTVDQAIGYGETAIAEAARPTLGEAGFTIMAIAALLATAGATNGTLFGSTNLTATLAEMGQFPPLLGRTSRLGKHGGLLIPAVLVLVVANLVDLSAIASVGSACSLIVFVLVGVAGYRLRRETGANAWIVLLGLAVTIVVLAFFAVDTLQNAPETFTAIIGITALAVVIDLVWKRVRPPSPELSGQAQPTLSKQS